MNQPPQNMQHGKFQNLHNFKNREIEKKISFLGPPQHFQPMDNGPRFHSEYSLRIINDRISIYISSMDVINCLIFYF